VKLKKKIMPDPENIELNLSDIHPSQPDDGNYSSSDGPVSVFFDRGKLIIKDGNHRYYRDLQDKGPDGKIQVEKTSNPHVDY